MRTPVSAEVLDTPARPAPSAPVLAELHSRWLRRRALRRNRKHGRLTLCCTVVGFVLIQLAMRVAIDWRYPMWRDPSFEIKAAQLQTAIKRSPGRPYVVTTFGSSSTGLSYNGRHLESLLNPDGTRPTVFYNMSDHGSGPLTDLIYLRRLLDRNIRPDLVVLEIFPNVFKTQGMPIDAEHFPVSRLEERDVNVIERYTADPSTWRNWWECRLVPSYGHRLAILHNVSLSLIPVAEELPLWGTYDERGWRETEPLTPAQLAETLPKVRALFPELEHFRPGQSSLAALEETLALLQRERIPTALVMNPVGPMMRGMYPAAGIAELKSRTTALAARYGATFCDAFTWLDEEMFNDSFHANVNGSKAFCDRLAREFLIPLRDSLLQRKDRACPQP